MESLFVQKLREDADYFDRFAAALQTHAKKLFRNHLRFIEKGAEWQQYRSYLRCLKHQSFRTLNAHTLNEIAARFNRGNFDSLCTFLLGPVTGERDVPAHGRATPAQQQWRKETKLIVPPRFAKHAAALWDFVRGHEKSPAMIPHPNALSTVFQARRRKIRDDEKIHSLIIEQSFITTVRPAAEIEAFATVDANSAGRLALPRSILRIDRDGHCVSKGSSVIQSMSEDFPPFSSLHAYLTELYCEEVTFTTEDPVGIRFLGIVSNNHRGIRYLFYVFEVSIADEVTLRLKVDQEDVATWVDQTSFSALINRVAANKTDVAVLRELLHLREPSDVDAGHAKAIYRGYDGDVIRRSYQSDFDLDANLIAKAGIDDWKKAGHSNA